MTTVNLPNSDSLDLYFDIKRVRIGIVVSEWNSDITKKLYQGASETLLKLGVENEKIVKKDVPGAFELTYGAKYLSSEGFDAIIVLGVVIKGETSHFDFVCSGVTHGITSLNLIGRMPVIFGVLTTDTKQQALDRAGGKLGNKGEEAAITAIKMINFKLMRN
ncbi:MAG: 6,7-dimethyl-8-ribityllumazine synthase [Bacteroidetes bacterium 4572_128]|nr:MAG: 6,7-dimethyl-8-ribityllumazine synthase [Bacteroidetes bacterium 4572_128]